MGNKSKSGSGIWDEHPGSYFRELRKQFLGLKILKFFDAVPESFLTWIRDPGGKNSDPGSGINIPDLQHCF